MPNVLLYRAYAVWVSRANGALASATLLVFPEKHSSFVQLLLQPSGGLPTDALALRQDLDDSSTCLLAGEGTQIFYEPKITRLLQEHHALLDPSSPLPDILSAVELRARASHLRIWCLGALGARSPPVLPSILFIERKVTRHLQNLDEVKSRLRAAFPQLAQSSYYGHEGLEETIRLFASAPIVFGFHGAGHSNCLYSPPNALAVEVTFKGEGGQHEAHVWRTNREVPASHPNLSWLAFPMELSDNTLPSWPALLQSTNLFAALQSVREVVIPSDELHQIITLMHDKVATAIASVTLTFDSTPLLDCAAGQNLREAFFGGEGASALRCAELCTADTRCGGFTWIASPTGCYTKEIARTDSPPTTDTPGCWRSDQAIWFSRRLAASSG